MKSAHESSLLSSTKPKRALLCRAHSLYLQLRASPQLGDNQASVLITIGNGSSHHLDWISSLMWTNVLTVRTIKLAAHKLTRTETVKCAGCDKLLICTTDVFRSTQSSDTAVDETHVIKPNKDARDTRQTNNVIDHVCAVRHANSQPA